MAMAQIKPTINTRTAKNFLFMKLHLQKLNFIFNAIRNFRNR